MNKQERVISIVQIAILGLVDCGVFFLGNNLEIFHILQVTNNEYSINYGRYACFLGFVGYNILTIYHIFVKNAVRAIVSFFDQNAKVREDIGSVRKDIGFARKDIGSVREGIKKVEAHLINYDSNSIEFNYLSAIEAEVGVSKQSIHNEIWVLTNNFEESNDSEEAIELRTAIKNNLMSNVDYYYVIPKSHITDMNELVRKVKSELGYARPNGSLKYITDDALDFIPTAYFDVVMYFKITVETGRIDDSSEVYYCFSRMSNIPKKDEQFFYQKVKEKEIMDKLKKRTQEYKIEKLSSFITAIN